MNAQTKAVLASWTKVFLTAVLAGVLTAMATNVWDWRALLFAGLTAVIPVVINWLSPNDPRYGRGYVVPPVVSADPGARGNVGDPDV